MFNVRLTPILILVGVTGAVWGCGDDPKETSGSGGRNTAGMSGKGGANAGGSSSGASGKGGGGAGSGGTNGGTGGKGGGTAGSGDAGGKGGTAGTGGTSAGTQSFGGIAGEGGDFFGGAGGEGGGANLTIERACRLSCRDQRGLACLDYPCVMNCLGFATDSPAPSEYDALTKCQALRLGPNDYVCRDQPSSPGAPQMVGNTWDGACEAELCAWTCADAMYVDEQTFYHCDC